MVSNAVVIAANSRSTMYSNEFDAFGPEHSSSGALMVDHLGIGSIHPNGIPWRSLAHGVGYRQARKGSRQTTSMFVMAAMGYMPGVGHHQEHCNKNVNNLRRDISRPSIFILMLLTPVQWFA